MPALPFLSWTPLGSWMDRERMHAGRTVGLRAVPWRVGTQQWSRLSADDFAGSPCSIALSPMQNGITIFRNFLKTIFRN